MTYILLIIYCIAYCAVDLKIKQLHNAQSDEEEYIKQSHWLCFILGMGLEPECHLLYNEENVGELD